MKKAVAMNHIRPILFVDVDEVILEFVAPFIRFLDERGLGFIQDRFAQPNNIIRPQSGEHVTSAFANRLLEQFWDEQETRQTVVAGAIEALADLSEIADIVILTAVSPQHEVRRGRLLRSFGLSHPIIIASREKGAIISEYIDDTSKKVFLIDDAPANHISLLTHVPEAFCVHIAAFKPFVTLMELPPSVFMAKDWNDAASFVRRTIAD